MYKNWPFPHRNEGKKMKKLIAIILVCACILPRIMTINITINNNFKIHKNKQIE